MLETFGGHCDLVAAEKEQAGHSAASEVTAKCPEREPTVTSVSRAMTSRKARIFVKIRERLRGFSPEIVYRGLGGGWVKTPNGDTFMLRKK